MAARTWLVYSSRLRSQFGHHARCSRESNYPLLHGAGRRPHRLRGLASLYAQANEFDIQAAKAFQVKWTPRGWMREDLDLLGFEQQLYLRQPGYGTSYVTGKYLIDELVKDRAQQLGEGFTLREFFDEFNAAGVIPVSLIQWELTGRR